MKRSYHHIPQASSVEAELWGLRHGLNLALNFYNSKVEVDASAVINLISNLLHPNLLQTLVDGGRLAYTFQAWTLNHTSPEANRCADALVRMESTFQPETPSVLFLSATKHLLSWLLFCLLMQMTMFCTDLDLNVMKC